MKFALTFIAACALTIGCGGKGGGLANTSDDLDKAGAVAVLEGVLAKIESKSYSDLEAVMAAPKGREAELAGMLEKMAPSLIEKKEISAEGIKVMADKGKYGTLAEVLPDRVESWSKRFGVKGDDCRAFSHENAQAAFCKMDGVWKIIRLNNLGKLAP